VNGEENTMPDEEKFATDFDGPWKDALDFAPELFLKRFLPDIDSAIDWRKPFGRNRLPAGRYTAMS
jgi:hypothetical protein